MKYNKLTQKLLTEGITVENYQKSKYRLPSMGGRETLDNYYGGFEYQRFYIYEKTFKTQCGLQCKGLECLVNLSFGGTEYCFENDNALVECPYGKKDCEYVDRELDELNLRFRCPVHIVKEEYVYEGNVEGLLKRMMDLKRCIRT